MNLSLSPLLLGAVGIQLSCQLYKVVYYSVKEKKFQGYLFFSAGGIPSAHAAFVSSLTTGIGLRNGLDSDVFALSFVFSTIVIYDAFRLRGAVEQQAKLLNRLTQTYLPAEHPGLNERIGHSLQEILWGIGAGIAGMLGFQLLRVL
ncbi:MAG: divergent PAP2 family protein [Spirochaetales bacterium]